MGLQGNLCSYLLQGHDWCFLLAFLQLPLKVREPRLKVERVGVFATRSPHRPCPIGLTVAKVEAVQGHEILLSGADLVDGIYLMLNLICHTVTVSKMQQSQSGYWIDNGNEYYPYTNKKRSHIECIRELCSNWKRRVG
ncbi:tRNA (adenine(37)-N6)-methyltransferase isoform X1 [Cucumis melo var. makuwa]|uniref:tRNA (Adenine(37)-N6)-methyltransferase isoform X1 n=1 Tax=Cucumis melo var. makuwa TaxID=1194695 RepID=A0A5D3DTF2_CUCMM|nr:tRNA (adenine(37)-N6)-methyltransferase isoform X1 [Cucumis melo var. makuwa]